MPWLLHTNVVPMHANRNQTQHAQHTGWCCACGAVVWLGWDWGGIVVWLGWVLGVAVVWLGWGWAVAGLGLGWGWNQQAPECRHI